MQPTSAVHWFAKCGFSAGALLLASGVATTWFGNGLQLPSTTTRDGTLITLNRYVREPVPDVVLVGSSLAFRLKEEYFATPRLRNLALAGAPPLRGWRSSRTSRAFPRSFWSKRMCYRGRRTLVWSRNIRVPKTQTVVFSANQNRRRGLRKSASRTTQSCAGFQRAASVARTATQRFR